MKVVLREMSNAEQAQALQDGGIDIGLMHTPVAVGGRMRERQLLRERLVAAVPDEFRWTRTDRPRWRASRRPAW